MSDKANYLRFLEFRDTSFAKIDSSQPVIVVFPDGVNLCLLEGDQAVGKTSVIEAFKAVLGLPEPENAENRVDKTKNVKLEFERNGKKYQVKVSKSRFELEQLVDDKWAKLASPKTMLQELIGPVGLSPMFLKEYDGKKQVQWLREFVRPSEEQIQMEKDIDLKITTAYATRRTAKKSHKEGEEWLKINTYYANRHDWATKLAAFKPVDIEQKLKDAQEKITLYAGYEQNLTTLQNNVPIIEEAILDIDKDIKELELKLAAARIKKENKLQEQQTNEQKIKDATKYLEDNKAIKTEFDNISAENKTQEEMKEHQKAYDLMIKGETRVNNLFLEVTQAEAKLDGFRKVKQDFIKAITPDVEGLEVFVADEENPKEGLYYEGRSIKEISESELWGLYSKLLQKLQVRVILIENISGIGSGAVEIFNNFIASGGYIMATQMDRQQKTIKISLLDKIAE